MGTCERRSILGKGGRLLKKVEREGRSSTLKNEVLKNTKTCCHRWYGGEPRVRVMSPGKKKLTTIRGDMTY